MTSVIGKQSGNVLKRECFMSYVFGVMERMQGDIARQLREGLGEQAYDQALFDEEQIARRVESMKQFRVDASPEERHEQWCKMHESKGWVYAPDFNPAMKTHPNLRAWHRLPLATRMKIGIFASVAIAAHELANGPPAPVAIEATPSSPLPPEPAKAPPKPVAKARKPKPIAEVKPAVDLAATAS